MLDFKYFRINNELMIETSLTGKPLLMTPQLNKGTAFTQDERIAFELVGKLPFHIETLAEQVSRVFAQYGELNDNMRKNIFLNALHDTNQILFYKLISQHISEMMPSIYTPIVGTAVKSFSKEFRKPRGLYISYPEQQHIGDILDNRSNPDIDVIVVTDGEGVLGIGDQGVGGMDIPVAKLMVYTICGGINPNRTLPILLDVGTNNLDLLNDPFYLGWNHKRIEGEDYDRFILRFITAIKEKFPNVFLHWEDFGRSNAARILNQFQNEICTFNDDIQGTGAVTLAALLAAIQSIGSPLKDQRIIIFGAGTAGIGIADEISLEMQRQGMSEQEAHEKFWMIDRHGLIIDSHDQITHGQQSYARKSDEIGTWQAPNDIISLSETVKQIKPTILIGCSAVRGAFTKGIINEMAKHTPQPIIFPLSNPTERCEATPEDLYKWTDNKALIATGSPFENIKLANREIRIAQCNNALVFPGIGLGIVSVKAKRLTPAMIAAATHALRDCSPILSDHEAPLLPSLEDAQHVAKRIAVAVAKVAFDDGLAQIEKPGNLEQHIEAKFWYPKYVPMQLKS